ncbi:RhuM family protein [Gelidibacter japonicus]|uniref:RhuM family protein n=1 Tax=Gelidibacter japonicus TaxID=1962232 RepID=UPI002AFE1B41|nr:RhuM family protein [Gelidibacter japonicus]
MEVNNKIEIYQDKETGITIDVQLDGETVWLDQYQLEALFNTDRTSISRHLRNIYKSNELDEKATSAKIAQVQQEGNREVKRNINVYNLDAILSVGYRVNSKKGTAFRIWANGILKDSFVDGNKLIAAACFLKFLQQNKMLFNSQQQPIICNDSLASLTLFIASSKPEERQTVTRLVISVLNRNKIN